MSEFLTPVEPNKYKEYIEEIGGFAQFAVFDIHSAKELSKITNLVNIKKQKKTKDIHKQKLKVDAQIVANAISNKCDYIISEDSDVHKLAKHYDKIKVGKMSHFIQEQTELFDKKKKN